MGFGGQGYVTEFVAEGSKRRLMVQRSSLGWYNHDGRVNGRKYIRPRISFGSQVGHRNGSCREAVGIRKISIK